MEMITVDYECVFCRGFNLLTVPREGYDRWKKGELIQRALPELSADEREVLISGICPECQKRIFG